MDDDLELELRLRAPRVVGERMLVLAAVCRRGFLEQAPDEAAGNPDADDDHDLEDAESERFDLVAWLREERLDGAATARERSLLHARIGRLSPEAIAAATWEAEALLALAWCTSQLAEQLRYDEPAPIHHLLDRLPAAWDATRPFLAKLALRPEAEIARERERAELWYWRAGVEAVYRQAAEDERRELRGLIREVAAEAANGGLLSLASGGDFGAAGTPVSRLAGPALDDLTAIAHARLKALNWVCGFGATWDDAPTDL